MVGARLVPGPAELVRAGVARSSPSLAAARYGATAEDLSAGAALLAGGAAAAFALVVDLGVVRDGRRGGAHGNERRCGPVAALLPVVAALPAVYRVGVDRRR